MKKLILLKTDTNIKFEATDNSMYSLFEALELLSHVEDYVRPRITAELEAGEHLDSNINDIFCLKAANKEDKFTIYFLYEEQDESYYITINQELLWESSRRYEEISDLPWKKLTITYDGDRVNFEPEY